MKKSSLSLTGLLCLGIAPLVIGVIILVYMLSLSTDSVNKNLPDEDPGYGYSESNTKGRFPAAAEQYQTPAPVVNDEKNERLKYLSFIISSMGAFNSIALGWLTFFYRRKEKE